MLNLIDYKSIQEKWLKKWEEAKLFEFDMNEKKGALVFAAFPYLNMPLHIGHLRTYGTVDLYSRYLRFKGLNVVFPMGFHKTGTPALAIAKRVKNNDKEVLNILKIYGVLENEIPNMTNAEYITEYFEKITREGLRKVGIGIDWRRSFTSIDPEFSKLIEWQFKKLKDKGYLVTGTHIIGWCPNEQNPVGQHDTKGDTQPEIEEIPLIKFKDTDSDIYFPCATYRPETIYAVTNIFINQNVDYVIVEIKEEKFYLSNKAADIMKYQLDLKVVEKISGKELLNKHAINPVTNENIPILPGFFVKEEFATGIVMSVPAHAPFDYAALERLHSENYSLPKMNYKSIIKIESNEKGIGVGRIKADVLSGKIKIENFDIPSKAYFEILNTNVNSTNEMLESTTKLQYKEELRWGRLTVDEYKDMKVSEARDSITKKLIEEENAIKISIIKNNNIVLCRCGFKIVPKMVNDQWFINYGNKEWKDKIIEYFDEMKVYPETMRNAFKAAFDWIDLRPTERSQGLGTKFPLNPNHIIESLSDSTIYTTFYTYNYILKNKGITTAQLKIEFFDYIYGYSNDIHLVSEATGIDTITIQKCKDNLYYWYNFTSNHSASDLIPSHLTMYIFNHVGLFEKELWPKQIVINGFVNYGGAKMSKSVGDLVPLLEGIDKFGADILKFIEVVTGDLETDIEFSITDYESIRSKNEWLYNLIERLNSFDTYPLSHIDYWLYSALNSKIKSSIGFMDTLSLRKAYIEIYYNSLNELRHYFARGGKNQIVLQEFIEKLIVMLSPIMPYLAEEMWNKIGHTDFVEREMWPIYDESLINTDYKLIEDMVQNTISDINGIMRLTIKSNPNYKPKLIKIIIADDWKVKAYNLLAEKGNIKEVMGNGAFAEIDKEKLSRYLLQFSKRIRQLNVVSTPKSDDIIEAFNSSKEFMKNIIGIGLQIEKESESSSDRAWRALPSKPAIDIA